MKIIYLHLFIFLFIGHFLLSCTVEKKYDTIFEKVIVDFIIQNKDDMNDIIKFDSIDNMIISIDKIYSVRPVEGVRDTSIKNIMYPNLDMYILSYANCYIENEVAPPPSRLFYIKGYPVMLYDPAISSMNSKNIPNSLRRNDKRWAIDNEWLLGICKKTHKYIVIRDLNNKGDDKIKELNSFFCEGNNDIN